MKIEKVNDNQIRCTLTKEDLAIRELKISELAYGTEKAKNLFRDMMQQANFEFGFEAEDIPLMIEAIPMNAECIVLIITKVEDPEELDTRFSRFAPSIHDDMEEIDGDGEDSETSEEVMNLFKKLHDSNKSSTKDSDIEVLDLSNKDTSNDKNAMRIYRFDTLQPIMNFAPCMLERFQGINSL